MKLPVKVWVGFQGEGDVETREFPDIDDAVKYVRHETQENVEIRQEKPETPRLVFWIQDRFPVKEARHAEKS